MSPVLSYFWLRQQEIYPLVLLQHMEQFQFSLSSWLAPINSKFDQNWLIRLIGLIFPADITNVGSHQAIDLFQKLLEIPLSV